MAVRADLRKEPECDEDEKPFVDPPGGTAGGIAFVAAEGGRVRGADGLAEEAIGELRPGYEPWFKTLWEPPSGEVESLLFALQAALGAGFIGYYLGYGKGKRDASNAGRGTAPDEKSLDAFRRT